jgi:penicillin-binding protein 1A
MTIRTALRTSSNRAAVHMLERVGIDQTISYVRGLGINNVPHAPSIALGSGEVTLLSMTAAYAAFAHAGITQEPTFIRRVEDREGNVLYRAKPHPRQVLSETTAFLMSNMLADVLDMGTAAGARAMGFSRPAAGKTGTTNNFADAWFVGFTPLVVAGVWVGYDQPRTIMPEGFAGRVAVPLWARFMIAATKDDPKIWFDQPPGVTAVQLCRVSGLLPAIGCRDVVSISDTGEVTRKSMVYTEYFASGTEPHQTCPIHVYHDEEPFILPPSATTTATTGILDLPAVPPPPPPAPPRRPEPPTTPMEVPTVAPSPPPPNEPPAQPINPDSLPVSPPGR